MAKSRSLSADTRPRAALCEIPHSGPSHLCGNPHTSRHRSGQAESPAFQHPDADALPIKRGCCVPMVISARIGYGWFTSLCQSGSVATQRVVWHITQHALAHHLGPRHGDQSVPDAADTRKPGPGVQTDMQTDMGRTDTRAQRPPHPGLNRADTLGLSRRRRHPDDPDQPTGQNKEGKHRPKEANRHQQTQRDTKAQTQIPPRSSHNSAPRAWHRQRSTDSAEPPAQAEAQPQRR